MEIVKIKNLPKPLEMIVFVEKNIRRKNFILSLEYIFFFGWLMLDSTPPPSSNGVKV